MTRKYKIEKTNIVIGLISNILLFVVKLFAGIFGGSSALVADGIHSVTDVSTDIAMLVGSKYWHTPPDEKHAYGHGRIETVITFGIGLILGFTATQLSVDAVVKLISGEQTIVQFWIFWVALSSVIIKEMLFYYTIMVAKKTGSMALRANAWHHRTDSLSSIPVAIAIYLTSFYPSLYWVDSVGVLLVAVIILKTCIDIVKPAFIQLIDTGADKKIVEIIREKTLQIPGVKDVHGIRTRYVGSYLIADLRIHINPGLSIQDADRLSLLVQKKLKENVESLRDVGVIIEPDEHDCAL